MRRALLLALLAALALPAAAAGVPAGAGDAPASLDVAAATAVQRETTAARLDRYALEEELSRVESTDTKKRLLFEAATAVEIRISGLRDDQRALRAAYLEREIETSTFVRRMARLDARAGLLREHLDVIQAQADAIPQFSLRARVRLLGAGLFGFEGPVRDRAAAVMAGSEPATRLYVQASSTGAVLATIDDGRYVREAHRADHQDAETSSIGFDEANDRASELYPTAYNLSNSLQTGLNSVSGGLFRIDIELQEGTITAYMDGSTGEVFFEVQERRLDLLGSRPSAVGVDNGTRLAVNRSYPGGPLAVAVTDEETGAPVDATVLVDGHPVGTGPDGQAWVLAPAKVTFEVT
ncbi:MAG: hypothetical protein GWN07_26925, partial [Actinobacteria bacterium]|nr:hypothetical protein [Actinomycetota bacterium]